MSTVTDIARHRADRLRVMNAIYEAAEGSPMSHVSGGWLLEHLELSDEELGGICRYLEDERLMIRPMRTMARSLPVTPGVAGRRGGWFPVPAPSAYTGSKKLAIYF